MNSSYIQQWMKHITFVSSRRHQTQKTHTDDSLVKVQKRKKLTHDDWGYRVSDWEGSLNSTHPSTMLVMFYFLSSVTVTQGCSSVKNYQIVHLWFTYLLQKKVTSKTNPGGCQRQEVKRGKVVRRYKFPVIIRSSSSGYVMPNMVTTVDNIMSYIWKLRGKKNRS